MHQYVYNHPQKDDLLLRNKVSLQLFLQYLDTIQFQKHFDIAPQLFHLIYLVLFNTKYRRKSTIPH